ncbi:MAG TPA: FAD-dependent oxidoreductase [Candidatus Paceibacterota bacterium]|nr:FAD-dependent oxidoreductase [Candidatus Paceibacterota bacterium]
MKLTLLEKRQEEENITTFVFEPSEALGWQAGQFLHYTLPHENMDDRGNERWFTISSAPFEKNVQITTRHAEKGSSFKNALFAMNPSDTIEADGPEGEFVIGNPSEKVVMIAGGIGITPFRSMLAELDHAGTPIKAKLLYANRDEHFVFKEELDQIAAKHPDFTIHYVVDPERIDENLIRNEVSDLTGPLFLVSGPKPMVLAFQDMLVSWGAPEDHVKRDSFPGYEWTGSSEK